MSTRCHIIRTGSKVQIMNKSESCCGTITQGWTGVVREYLEDSHGKIIVVLEDGTLAWAEDLKVIVK